MHLSISHKFWSKKLICEKSVSFNKTVVGKWTRGALDCYYIGCTCARCNLYKIYFKETKSVCKMKKIVLELVKRFGIPEEKNNKEFCENVCLKT